MVVRIIVADDHPIVREGLKKILDQTADLVVVDEAASGEELLAKVRQNACDVVLLDITMPGRGGLEMLEQLKTEIPRLHILVVSMHPEEKYAIRILKAGASGYLTKDKAPAELIHAIRKVATGGKYVSPSLAEKLAFELVSSPTETPHESLSNREFQVMVMIASGKTVTEIAKEMSLSDRTISTYRTRILDKMQLRTSAELTYYAITNGLLD